MTRQDPALFALLATLWDLPADDPRRAVLPLDAARLTGFHAALAALVDATPRRAAGRIDRAAIVRGDVVALGEDSAIEAGAVIHESCRLVLGARSVVRAGAVLRGDVVVGDDCLIGVHCEVVRSLVLGPSTYLGHFIYLGDSIVGREVNIAGNVMVANTLVDKGAEVVLRHGAARLATGRTHLGALVGDRVRFGASDTLSPGTVILPGIHLPPHVALVGTIDAARAKRLLREFARAWHR